MVNRAADEKWLSGIRIARAAPTISNLCFADARAKLNEDHENMRILDKYVPASGHVINLEKSQMIFSTNTSPSSLDSIHAALCIQVVDKFDRYLGLSTQIGKSKREVFEFLKDHLWNWVKGCSERELSMADREVLIKAVLQAIPTYIMSCFILPHPIIRESEQIIRKYWWGSHNYMEFLALGQHWG